MNPTSTSEKAFLSEDFLLKSDFAKILYHDYARNLPIIDYHGHRYGKRATSSGRKVAWKTSE